MQMIGAQGDNAFSDVTKLSEMSSSDVDSHNPVYGLKSNLIRLIGNMAHRNRGNQDLVSDVIVVVTASCVYECAAYLN